MWVELLQVKHIPQIVLSKPTPQFLLTLPFTFQLFFSSQPGLCSVLLTDLLGGLLCRPETFPIHTTLLFSFKASYWEPWGGGGGALEYLQFCYYPKLGLCTRFILCNRNILKEMFSWLYQLGLGLTTRNLFFLFYYFSFIYQRPRDQPLWLIWQFYVWSGRSLLPLLSCRSCTWILPHGPLWLLPLHSLGPHSTQQGEREQEAVPSPFKSTSSQASQNCHLTFYLT